MKKLKVVFFSLIIAIILIIAYNSSKPAQKNKTLTANSNKPKDTVLVVSGDEDKNLNTQSSTNSQSKNSTQSSQTSQSSQNTTNTNYQKYTGTWKINNTNGHTTLVITNINGTSLSAKIATVYGNNAHISNATFNCILKGNSGAVKFTDSTGAVIQGTITLSGSNAIMNLKVIKAGKGYNIQTGNLTFKK